MNIIYGTVLSQCDATDAFYSNSSRIFLTQLWGVGDRSKGRVWVKLAKSLKRPNFYGRRSAGWKRRRCSFTGARGEKICQNQTPMMDSRKSHPQQWGRKSWRNFKLNKIWQKCSTSCLPSSVWGFCTWSQLSRDGCHHPLPERYNESVADTRPTCYKSCWETWSVPPPPRFPFWNTQYIISVPFIHDSFVVADMCCVTLRDGGKSHLKNRMVGHRKCIICALPTLRNSKYKCKSRCERKQQVCSSLLPLWFPPAEVPLSFTKMELFKGSTAPHVSFREPLRGRLLRLVSKESNLKLSEHPKLCPLSSEGAAVMNGGIRVAYLLLAGGKHGKRSILLGLMLVFFLILQNVKMWGSTCSKSQLHTRTSMRELCRVN